MKEIEVTRDDVRDIDPSTGYTLLADGRCVPLARIRYIGEASVPVTVSEVPYVGTEASQTVMKGVPSEYMSGLPA